MNIDFWTLRCFFTFHGKKKLIKRPHSKKVDLFKTKNSGIAFILCKRKLLEESKQLSESGLAER